MGDKSKIEWTDASWNPIVGCSKVSEGCRNCYAIRSANRMNGSNELYNGLTKQVNGNIEWTNIVRFSEERLLQPLKWKRPRKIFVNSMSDLFHESVSDAQIENIFAVMCVAQKHIFQVLTKRPERMKSFLIQPHIKDSVRFKVEEGLGYNIDFDKMWPIVNVWLGVSVEDQKTADERIPLLLQTPAAIRWISAEPLLGHMNVEPYLGIESEDGYDLPHLNWIVAGGESGPNARPSHPTWFRSLRDQALEYNVPFFFKQWGEWIAAGQTISNPMWMPKNILSSKFPDGQNTMRLTRKLDSHTLDGKEWNEFPDLENLLA